MFDTAIKLTKEQCGFLSDDGMVNVMAPTIAACVGGSIGWVLSDTRWHGGRRTEISMAPTAPRAQAAPALAA